MIALKSISEKRLAFLLVLAFMFNSLFPIVNLMVCHSHQHVTIMIVTTGAILLD